jgi:hypothetical protein
MTTTSGRTRPEFSGGGTNVTAGAAEMKGKCPKAEWRNACVRLNNTSGRPEALSDSGFSLPTLDNFEPPVLHFRPKPMH